MPLTWRTSTTFTTTPLATRYSCHIARSDDIHEEAGALLVSSDPSTLQGMLSCNAFAGAAADQAHDLLD